MFNIDFSKLPEIEKKLAPIEIEKLNGIFREPSVQSQLETIEEQRKIRAKWKWGVNGLTVLVATGFSLVLGQGDILAGFFYTVGSGDNSFSPTIWTTIFTYTVAKGALYKRFASRIEIPLKQEVLSKLCPILYSKLEYSHDEKHSFDELDILRAKNFIASFDRIDRVEDSTHFTMEKDGKSLELNGFELKTSEMQGSGKNRSRVTTNHCYLMKAVFPNARIPLTNDLLIVQDEADSYHGMGLLNKIVATFGIAVLGTVISYMTLTIVIGMMTTSEKAIFLTSAFIGIILGFIGYKLYKKDTNKNRVRLENIEFEKLFDVKCEDQVTSRMIITPAFMDRIVQFVEKTGNQYEFIFQSNIMYIKRQITGSYLEAGTEKNMLTNLEGFSQFYMDMREIIQFVYDMNLMYLSKTDTSQAIESNQNNSITPIHFSKEASGGVGIFGKFFSGLKLRM